MSLKMECHSKWNITQNLISVKMECHLKWNFTQNRKLIVTQKWNVTKMEDHSKFIVI